jgi:hypothetical protein
MTAHPDRYQRPPDHPPVQTNDPAATRDDAPRVAGPVPITVWRLDDRDDDQPTTEPGAGFASRLAKRLVLVYTSHGQTVIDLDDDAYLHRAATTTGRSYLAVTESTRLADLDQISQAASLVTLRWPRTAALGNADQLAELLSACRDMMTGDASLVAAVRPAEPATTFADHEHALHSAAEAAGLAHVLQIVAVSAPGEGDQFLYYATEAEATHAATQAAATPGRQVLHIDLLVFVPRHPLEQQRVTGASRRG